MIPWIQVYSNLPSHPKTAKLAEELKLTSGSISPNIIAVGILVGIWTWAIQNAYDGDLSSCSPGVIADACRWKKNPEQLITALKRSGYLDNDMKLHDWDEYAVLMIDSEDNRREKNRERVKRYREKKRGTDTTDNNGYSNASCNVTETPCNAPTGHNITGHNITNYSGGGDTRERADAQEDNPVENYMDEYDVSVDRYFAADDVKPEIAKLTQQLFAGLANRQPTTADDAQVFRIVTKAAKDPLTGDWVRWIDEDARDLLIHAFRLAAESGKAGDWKYINGILSRFEQRGIKNISEAENFQAERDMAKDGIF